MAKQTAIRLTKTEARLMAGLATALAGSILARLVENGVLDEDDLELILARLAAADLGSPAMARIAGLMAASLRSQLVTIRAN